MNQSMTIGIDLAKHVFFVAALDGSGKPPRRKKLRRHEVLSFLANHPGAIVGMEACSGAHHWAREIRALGHSVQLLPAQHVKAYLRGQKNDYNDALAIAEAVQHGRIRCVEIKTVDQQLDQSLHRLRQALVTEQTGLINRTRALLAEHGVDLPEVKHRFRQAVIAQLEDAQNGLPWRLRELLGQRA